MRRPCWGRVPESGATLTNAFSPESSGPATRHSSGTDLQMTKRSRPDDPRKWSAGYPTALDGSPEDISALEAIDAVLAALSNPRALAEAVAANEGGIFTRSDGSPFRPLASGQIEEIWDRAEGRIHFGQNPPTTQGSALGKSRRLRMRGPNTAIGRRATRTVPTASPTARCLRQVTTTIGSRQAALPHTVAGRWQCRAVVLLGHGRSIGALARASAGAVRRRNPDLGDQRFENSGRRLLAVPRDGVRRRNTAIDPGDLLRWSPD